MITPGNVWQHSPESHTGECPYAGKHTAMTRRYDNPLSLYKMIIVQNEGHT